MLTDISAADLLAAPCGSSEPSAVEAARVRDVVVRHLDAVCRTAQRLGVGAADLDDLAQEVALVVMKRAPAIEAGKERAFMLATAVRITANWWRARRRQRERVAELAADVAGVEAIEATVAPAQERELERTRGLALLDAALAEMTDGQRAAFVLFELEELSAKEIAEQLEIPEAAVVSRVRRAREMFQRFCRQCQRVSGEPR
jgi:RNA polymerase sigma-70 factor, ECF subfamily